VRSAFAEIVADTRHSIVRVKYNGDDVALGTVVGSDGWIVTKASELPGRDGIVCALTDGRELPARLVGTDSSTDLALVRVAATGLTPVQFHKGKFVPGMWLATPGQSELPLAIGIVSNAERAIAGSPGVMGVIIEDLDAGPAIQQVLAGSGAAAAGIQVGDVVTHIASERVRSMVELQAAVRRHRVGEVITAVIRRDGMKLELAVRLGMPEDTVADVPVPGRPRGQGSAQPTWRGAISHRRDDFPSAIQHDTVLRPSDCGGPVLDSAGRVVGINIARADRTASYALAGIVVLSQIEKLQGADTAGR
jgi:serine protease Do